MSSAAPIPSSSPTISPKPTPIPTPLTQVTNPGFELDTTGGPGVTISNWPNVGGGDAFPLQNPAARSGNGFAVLRYDETITNAVPKISQTLPDLDTTKAYTFTFYHGRGVIEPNVRCNLLVSFDDILVSDTGFLVGPQDETYTQGITTPAIPSSSTAALAFEVQCIRTSPPNGQRTVFEIRLDDVAVAAPAGNAASSSPAISSSSSDVQSSMSSIPTPVSSSLALISSVVPNSVAPISSSMSSAIISTTPTPTPTPMPTPAPPTQIINPSFEADSTAGRGIPITGWSNIGGGQVFAERSAEYSNSGSALCVITYDSSFPDPLPILSQTLTGLDTSKAYAFTFSFLPYRGPSGAQCTFSTSLGSKIIYFMELRPGAGFDEVAPYITVTTVPVIPSSSSGALNFKYQCTRLTEDGQLVVAALRLDDVAIAASTSNAASSSPVPISSPLSSAINSATPPSSSDVKPLPTPFPSSDSTPTPTPTPDASRNLIQNPDFESPRDANGGAPFWSAHNVNPVPVVLSDTKPAHGGTQYAVLTVDSPTLASKISSTDIDSTAYYTASVYYSLDALNPGITCAFSVHLDTKTTFLNLSQRNLRTSDLGAAGAPKWQAAGRSQFRVTDGSDVTFRIKLSCGSATGAVLFIDDVSLEKMP
ncbi:hypothetical protein NX059_011473 [Plenodomus lindquistii]|nr:hypothetical protein NX059_011473 [Plenodomus lindquistii]